MVVVVLVVTAKAIAAPLDRLTGLDILAFTDDLGWLATGLVDVMIDWGKADSNGGLRRSKCGTACSKR